MTQPAGARGVSRTFRLDSHLTVAAERFWSAQSLATVNAELHPWYRMTAPRAWLQRPIHEWGSHKKLLESWIRWRGLVPVDRHVFGAIDFPAPRTFVETCG